MNLLRQDRAPVLLALAGVTIIAWLYLLFVPQSTDMAMGEMPGMPDMAMPFAAPWVFAMWWVMMLGMMLPSAAPMILTFSTLQRRKRQREGTSVPTVLFVAGYLLVWGMFSAVATTAQWALQRYALLSPALAVASAGTRWRSVHPGRHLSVHAAEACVPQSLPVTVRFSPEPLARWAGGGIAHGR